jgi:hypothetical protein
MLKILLLKAKYREVGKKIQEESAVGTFRRSYSFFLQEVCRIFFIPQGKALCFNQLCTIVSA